MPLHRRDDRAARNENAHVLVGRALGADETLEIEDVSHLPAGMYAMKVVIDNSIYRMNVMKK